jgi:hypothetical protein
MHLQLQVLLLLVFLREVLAQHLYQLLLTNILIQATQELPELLYQLVETAMLQLVHLLLEFSVPALCPPIASGQQQNDAGIQRRTG